jgi:hypothetical protein
MWEITGNLDLTYPDGWGSAFAKTSNIYEVDGKALKEDLANFGLQQYFASRQDPRFFFERYRLYLSGNKNPMLVRQWLNNTVSRLSTLCYEGFTIRLDCLEEDTEELYNPFKNNYIRYVSHDKTGGLKMKRFDYTLIDKEELSEYREESKAYSEIQKLYIANPEQKFSFKDLSVYLGLVQSSKIRN